MTIVFLIWQGPWGPEPLYAEKIKAYTTTTERKSFEELVWPQRKTFQVSGGYKAPTKTRKTISTTEIFPLWPPFFRQRKVLHWSRAVYAFFFPAYELNQREKNKELKKEIGKGSFVREGFE